jgi:prepilin-type N-terminal cleavage/methylation domain-containing protein
MVRSRAFTLVETAVTIMIISMVAVLAYSFVGGSSTASASKPARLAVSRVVVAEQVFASSTGRFTPSPSQITSVGRDLVVTTRPSTGPEVASIAVSDADTLVVAVLAVDGVCYYSTVTSLAVSSTVTDSTTTDTCSAAVLLPPGESPLPDEPV